MAKKQTQDETIVEKNITQRCGGFSFRVRMTVSGLRIDENFNTLQEARAFRDRKRADLALDPTAKLVLQSREIKREAAKLTFDALLNRYAIEITSDKKGKRAELLRINKLRRFPIATLPIQLIDRTALLRFMDEGKKERWSSSTLRKYVMLISGVFTTAIKRWGYSFDNPVRAIEVPSNGTSRNRRLELGEYDRLLAEMNRCRTHYMAPLFILAVETAARRGELLKVQWSNVDLETGTAIFLDTKNGDDRIIPLSLRARQTLRGLADEEAKRIARKNKGEIIPMSAKRPPNGLPRQLIGRVFPLEEYQARSAFESARSRARRQYEKECKKDGKAADPAYLTDLRFHDLRHEATTRLFERGFDMMEAASVTGHKTLAMLKRYTHLRAEDLARKMG
jgi:integrase